jgi:large subunit ribosomal protein L10
MVSERKKKELEDLKKLVNEYSVIALIDLYKLPSGQLHSIKKDLRKQAIIRMFKKNIVKLGFEKSKKKGLKDLIELEAKKPALIFTNTNPFKLFKLVEGNKSPAYAKEGDVAINDIVIPEGPTKLMAGPAIGDLQKAKIPAKVQEGKIHVIKDTKIAKKGDVLDAQKANLLKKLGIQTVEIGINIVSVWEDGTIFHREVLDVDEQAYLNNLMVAASYGINLAVNIAYPTKDTIELLLSKAHQEARILGIETALLEKGVIEDLLAKGGAQAKTLKGEIKFE